MKDVMLWAGAGQIGMAIARRMGAGMKIIVGDKKLATAQGIAKTMNEAGFDVTPVEMIYRAASPFRPSSPRGRSTARSRCSSTRRACRPVRRPSRRS